MKVSVAEKCGFCHGVRNAISVAEKILAKENDVYSFGPIIHNKDVVERLAQSGLKTVGKVEEIHSGTVLIRSHGAAPKQIAKLKDKGLKIVDATCILVKRVQHIAGELEKEGYKNIDCKVVKSGDVMQDTAIFYSQFMKKPEISIDKDFILATIHRAENTDDEQRLKSIFEAFSEISKEKLIILPLHPRTKKIIAVKNIILPPNIKIIDPVGYLEMVWLLSNCSLVMTDSGGLQKEAFFFKKQCITLRDETEWVELISNGFNVIAGASKDNIINAYTNIKIDSNFNVNLYGEGKASENIVNELIKFQ